MNVLWDLDGTILDTYPSLVEAFCSLSERELNKEEVLKVLKIDSKLAFKRFGISENLRQNFKKKDMSQRIEDKKPFNYVREALKTTNKNFLVTNRDRESTIILLKHYNLYDFFEIIISTEDDGFLRKPSNTSYKSIKENFEIDLVIGDRELDLIPARELGIKTCAFQNDKVEADFYLENYSEFYKLLLIFKYNIIVENNNDKIDEGFLKKFFFENSDRYKHIMGVSNKMKGSPEAILHDIGYSEKIKKTGFHPLDGGLFVLEKGFSDEIIKCVLFHSFSLGEAILRGGELKEIYEKIAMFITPLEKQKIDYLTYCDMTTSSIGKKIKINERLEDIYKRYDKNTIVYNNIKRSEHYLKFLEKKYNFSKE